MVREWRRIYLLQVIGSLEIQSCGDSMSILSDLKPLLGIEEEYTVYDKELIAYINGFLLTAWQIGLIKDRKIVVDESSDWSDVFVDEISDRCATWLAMNIRMTFDPPQGAAAESIRHFIDEETWRLREQIESKVFNESEES